jgi:hypothetical protein
MTERSGKRAWWDDDRFVLRASADSYSRPGGMANCAFSSSLNSL